MANKYREFYRDAHLQLFDIIVKQVWLDQHFIYGGQTRQKRTGNGFAVDWAFAYFMRSIVGTSQKVTTLNPVFTAVSTFLIDFFPDFLKHNPFKEPEYYKYPFENVSLDHLLFVYQIVDVRLDMLQYAEEKKLNTGEFTNWVANYIFCYNDEKGKDIYSLTSSYPGFPHVRNAQLKRSWGNEKFKFKK